MINLPAEINQAIQEYNENKEKDMELVRLASNKVAELENALDTARTELSEAITESVKNPSEQNEATERTVRQKIGEIESDLQAAKERHVRAGEIASNRADLSKATAVIKQAKEAAYDMLQENEPVKLKDIEEAKAAYLEALVDYGTLIDDARKMVFETAQLTNPNAFESVGYPEGKTIAWGYRAHPYSDGKRYTVFADEISHALERGELKQN
ncbi:hypothetical protein [Evansella clarkii]|uniref:hypothetical protein n=1 Tax=Evansella clarkii TaxID=79879 RepID=UPI000B44C93A|nr:hypothetical protein [Evansella clarkii]